METNNASLNRRKFIGGVTAAAAGISIVPRHVLGGNNYIAPSDKINIAYIGCGTQGLRELPELLNIPEVQVTAVCDPQKEAIGYYDWDTTSLLNSLRETMGNPNWKPGGDNKIPGGLNVGKAVVDGYYNKSGGKSNCAAYADFREMLEKEKDLDAVKIMATDHLHGVIATAAMKHGKHISMHKPIANRLHEGFEVIERAKKSEVITHFIPWDTNGSMEQVMAWLNGGVIGQLKEVHCWTNRPVWPQYSVLPTDKPALPKGFDWDLWLGPEANRPYHPNYTNMVFRGWYDFGGGSMADMGHYSLWTVFKALQLENPTLIEPTFSHVCRLKDNGTSYKIENDFAFPHASTMRFKYPEKNNRKALDLIWYDGGMRPTVPDDFRAQNKELPEEGLMFMGEKGIIMSSEFFLREPYVLSGDIKLSEDLKLTESKKGEYENGIARFIEGLRNNNQITGNIREAWPITEAVNLYAVALRSGKALKYDASKRLITNVTDANKYLTREYRKGWSLEEI